MGAGQSSSNGAAGASSEQDVKTSYYELLGVDRQAADDVIKKAYRKKALELHPDRNYGNEQAATKTFAEVQAAYEVLSDPQERAWYDSHESSILRGQDVDDQEMPTYSNVRMTSADDLARMLRKFNSNVEFTDAPSGFFGYIRETFEQLAKEEEIAGDWENVDVREYPTFGHKDDTHDDVVKQFYLAWASFSTVKSFAWKDKYRLSEAPDRRIRRLMEKENNNMRQEGIREFNEAVRALVAFVRKRDPRYTPSTQSEAERQKTLRDAAAAQAARARKANEAKMNTEIPEWTKITHTEHDELEGTFEEESEEELIFECVACNKNFKSERQYEAHEKSKKHQKAIQALQRKMKKDNANMDLGSVVASQQVDEEDYELIEDPAEAEDVNGDEGDAATDEPTIDAHKNEKSRPDSESSASEEEEQPEEKDQEHVQPKPADDSTTSDEDEDYASPEAIRERLQETRLEAPTTGVSDNETGESKPKLGKAAQKRAKRAAAAAATSDETDMSNKCASCNASFPSRTRLFQHIKDHGHAALKSTAGGSGKGKKGKVKR